MTPDEVRSLLEELATRLDAAGVTAGIRVVGGAAISILDQDRRSTSDVDAVIVPAGAAADIAAELTRERSLPDNWLNDAALAYIPPVGTDDWVEDFRTGDVSASIGSAQMLLAMKLLANRGVRDSDDIKCLLAACDVRSLDDAQAVYERYHAQDVLSPSAARSCAARLYPIRSSSCTHEDPRCDGRRVSRSMTFSTSIPSFGSAPGNAPTHASHRPGPVEKPTHGLLK